MSCKKGSNWVDQETRTFLELCIEKQILSIMDGKRHRHVEIFRLLVPEMTSRGYNKTAEQMKLKLKNLKLAYFKCRRDNNISGAAKTRCPFYNEMELLYGCRPSAEASSSSGIDTAASNNNDNDNNNVDNTTEDVQDDDAVDTSEVTEVNIEGDEEPTVKKRKKTTQCGRKSYKATLENYTEKWLELQQSMLNSTIEQQDKLQKEFIQQEIEKQREWAQKEMEKERDFQRKQTNLIIQTFLQSTLRPQIPVFPQNNYTSLKLIPMNNAGPSTSFKIVNQKEKENIKPQTETTTPEENSSKQL